MNINDARFKEVTEQQLTANCQRHLTKIRRPLTPWWSAPCTSPAGLPLERRNNAKPPTHRRTWNGAGVADVIIASHNEAVRWHGDRYVLGHRQDRAAVGAVVEAEYLYCQSSL